MDPVQLSPGFQGVEVSPDSLPGHTELSGEAFDGHCAGLVDQLQDPVLAFEGE